jgi:putative membrane protein
MMGFHDGDWSGGGWLAMSSMMLLFWAVVIALVVCAVRNRSGERQLPHGDITNTASPEDILAERYARGDIDDDEFQHRRDLLRSKSDSGTHTRSTR